MIDVSDLVLCDYKFEPNLTTSHNCASVVREVLRRLGFADAADAMPVMPEDALRALNRPLEDQPWTRIGSERALARMAGDVITTVDPRNNEDGVLVLLETNGRRVLTATADRGVCIAPLRAFKYIKAIYRPTR